jgi:hypothetical protein
MRLMTNQEYEELKGALFNSDVIEKELKTQGAWETPRG